MSKKTRIDGTLKHLRMQIGASQTDVAKAVDIPVANISHYERNVSQPNIDTLKKLAAYFEVSVDYLVSYDAWVSPKKRLPRQHDDCPLRVWVLIHWKNITLNGEAIFKKGKFIYQGDDVTEKVLKWRPIPDNPIL